MFIEFATHPIHAPPRTDSNRDVCACDGCLKSEPEMNVSDGTMHETALCRFSRYPLICLLLSAVVASAAAAGQPPFSFQLHSFNDLRKHNQNSCCTLRCGLTRRFQGNGLNCCPKPPPRFVPPCSSKCLSFLNAAFMLFTTHSRRLQVDIQWLPSVLCSLQCRVASQDPRGCFVLNHDTVDSTSRRTINSTEDMVAYLPLVPQFQDSSRQTFLSLCFKGCGGLLCPCGGSGLTSRSSDWLSLVDDLLDNLNSTIAKHALNIRIVLDGTANPAATHSPCLAERWRPLPSLFTAGNGKRLAAVQICV